MHSIFFKAFLVLIFTYLSSIAQSSPIRINQIGYEKNGPKTAVYQSGSSSENITEYELLDSQNNSVKTGSVTKDGAVDGWSGRYFWSIDFSDFKEEGIYKLKVGSETSFEFEIKEDLYLEKTLEGLLSCFEKMRNTDEKDRNIPLVGSNDSISSETVNVYGGYNEASGDDSKHITHLQYSNYMCSQETPMLTWGLLRAYEINKEQVESMSLKGDLIDEVAWGADYLMRSLHDDGYFYSTVFNGWESIAWIDRVVCAYAVIDLLSTKLNVTDDYQTAFREGGGTAIAALAKAAQFGVSSDEYSSDEYLQGAIKAYDHIKANNKIYCDNGYENLLDEYAACIAAIELYKATDQEKYKTDAGEWVDRILGRITDEGWFSADDGQERPYFHAAEEGFPFVALSYYMTIDKNKNSAIREVLKKNIDWYFKITNEVTNPFNYARLYARSFANDDNLALGKDIWAKSEQLNDENPGEFAAENAVDGNQVNFWLSEIKKGEPDETDWIAIDLGQKEEINKIVINWEWQYAKKYIVQFSDDGETWTDEISNEITECGAVAHDFEEKVTTQYIRIMCLELAEDDPESQTGYGIHEIEVYKENNSTFFTKSFFIPHNNETGYWWQGENARLGSMTAGLLWAARALDDEYVLGTDSISKLAMSQLDWILGKNPYEVCMLYGYGTVNHEDYKADPNSNKGSIVGGICNGITAGNEDEAEVDFAPYSSGAEGWMNWRWLEQWLPHEAWFMFATSSISYMLREGEVSNVTGANNGSVKPMNLTLIESNKTLNIKINSSNQNLAGSVLKIVDIKGRAIKKISLSGNERVISISKNDLSSGMYFVELKTINKRVVREKLNILK